MMLGWIMVSIWFQLELDVCSNVDNQPPPNRKIHPQVHIVNSSYLVLSYIFLLGATSFEPIAVPNFWFIQSNDLTE